MCSTMESKSSTLNQDGADDARQRFIVEVFRPRLIQSLMRIAVAYTVSAISLQLPSTLWTLLLRYPISAAQVIIWTCCLAVAIGSFVVVHFAIFARHFTVSVTSRNALTRSPSVLAPSMVFSFIVGCLLYTTNSSLLLPQMLTHSTGDGLVVCGIASCIVSYQLISGRGRIDVVGGRAASLRASPPNLWSVAAICLGRELAVICGIFAMIKLISGFTLSVNIATVAVSLLQSLSSLVVLSLTTSLLPVVVVHSAAVSVLLRTAFHYFNVTMGKPLADDTYDIDSLVELIAESKHDHTANVESEYTDLVTWTALADLCQSKSSRTQLFTVTSIGHNGRAWAKFRVAMVGQMHLFVESINVAVEDKSGKDITSAVKSDGEQTDKTVNEMTSPLRRLQSPFSASLRQRSTVANRLTAGSRSPLRSDSANPVDSREKLAKAVVDIACAQCHVITVAVECLSAAVIGSVDEDTYGLVQQDLDTVFTTLFELQYTVENCLSIVKLAPEWTSMILSAQSNRESSAIRAACPVSLAPTSKFRRMAHLETGMSRPSTHLRSAIVRAEVEECRPSMDTTLIRQCFNFERVPLVELYAWNSLVKLKTLLHLRLIEICRTYGHQCMEDTVIDRLISRDRVKERLRLYVEAAG